MEYIDYEHEKFDETIMEMSNNYGLVADFKRIKKPHNHNYLSRDYFKAVHESVNALNCSLNKLVYSFSVSSVQADDTALTVFPVSGLNAYSI